MRASNQLPVSVPEPSELPLPSRKDHLRRRVSLQPHSGVLGLARSLAIDRRAWRRVRARHGECVGNRRSLGPDHRRFCAVERGRGLRDRHRGRRCDDDRHAGIEDHAFGQFAIRVNAYRRPVRGALLGDRGFRETKVRKEEQGEQRCTDLPEVRQQRHLARSAPHNGPSLRRRCTILQCAVRTGLIQIKRAKKSPMRLRSSSTIPSCQCFARRSNTAVMPLFDDAIMPVFCPTCQMYFG